MLHVVMLAGGKSQRMLSDLPKVLHDLGGKPLLMHLIESVLQLKPEAISIVYNDERVHQTFKSFDNIRWVLQKQQLGTGHAIAQVLPTLKENDRVLILPGDTPLISFNTLDAFIKNTPCHAVGLATQTANTPKGLGRIVRDEYQEVLSIIEEKDASEAQKQLNEVNLGFYLISGDFLKRWIPLLENQNAQREYYLTDIVKIAREKKVPITTFSDVLIEEAQGINTRYELSLVEQHYQNIKRRHLLKQGLGLKDPNSFWLYGDVQFGRDVVIHPHVTLHGRVVLGDRVTVSPYTVLKDVTIAQEVHIESFCVLKDVKIQEGVKIGPFAHIHHQVELMEHSIVGNFVEITRSQIGASSKIKHLSYMGDVRMKERVNIGAGTISCNYDGAQKHITTIEKEAHIGANTAMVAPITIEAGSTIGAGSVITQDAPADKLTLARAHQVTIENWKKPGAQSKKE